MLQLLNIENFNIKSIKIMSEKIVPQQKESILINGDKAICDGPGTDKHPRVFLKFENEQVTCPYCGNDFRQSDRVDSLAAH